MDALYIVILVLLILVAIALIACVLMQQGQRQGLGAISGGAETFLGKNAASSLEGRLKKYTKILAVSFIVLAIISTMISAQIHEVPELDLSSLTDSNPIVEYSEDGLTHTHADGTVHNNEEVILPFDDIVDDSVESTDGTADDAAEPTDDIADDAAEPTDDTADDAVEATNDTVEPTVDDAADTTEEQDVA